MEPNQKPTNLPPNPPESIVPPTNTSNGQVEQQNLISSRQPSYMRASVSGAYDDRFLKKKHGIVSTLIFVLFIGSVIGLFVWLFAFDGKFMISTFPLTRNYDEKYSILVPFSYTKTELEWSGGTVSRSFASPKNSKGDIATINITSGNNPSANNQIESGRLSKLADLNVQNYRDVPKIENVSLKKDKNNDQDRYIVKFEETTKEGSVWNKIIVYTSGAKYTCVATLNFLTTDKNMSDKFTDIINSLKVN